MHDSVLYQRGRCGYRKARYRTCEVHAWSQVHSALPPWGTIAANLAQNSRHCLGDSPLTQRDSASLTKPRAAMHSSNAGTPEVRQSASAFCQAATNAGSGSQLILQYPTKFIRQSLVTVRGQPACQTSRSVGKPKKTPFIKTAAGTIISRGPKRFHNGGEPEKVASP